MTNIFLDIHPFRSTLSIVIWSSPTRFLEAIIVQQDPRVHHNLLSEIISHTIAYIINIDKPQVQLWTHLAEATPSSNFIQRSQGITQQQPDNTTTTTLLQQPYQLPRQHHNYLIEHLEGNIEQAHRLAGKRAFTSDDFNELCKTSLQLSNRRHAQDRATTSKEDRSQPSQLWDPPTSSSSTSSNYNDRVQQSRHPTNDRVQQ